MGQEDQNNQPVDDQDVIEDQGGEEQAQPDPLVNLKSEFSRKLENQNARFNDLNSKLESILQTVTTSRQQQQPQQPQVKLSELMQDDPDAYARVIEERVASRADSIVTDRMNRAHATQSAVQDVLAKYPEFSQDGSEAAKLAIQKASSQAQYLKGTPEGAKMALLEAAAELGLVPASKRSSAQQQQGRQNADDFAISGQSQGSTRQQRRADPAKEIDPRTLEFAKLLNPNMDEARMKRLSAASKRTKWNKYE